MDVNEFRKITFPFCQASKNFNKVFGIGANKTGTTSLQQVFQILGFKVAPQQEGELYGVQAYRGYFDELRRYIEKYDAFQDAPFSIKTTFAQVDSLFPNSKFILTVREPEKWFFSLLNFHKKIMCSNSSEIRPTKEQISNFPYLYPGYIKYMAENNWLLSLKENYEIAIDWDLSYSKEHYIRLYLERNQAIVRHFSARPKDLLVIDITKESDTSRIVDFLGLPAELTTLVPHENKT